MDALRALAARLEEASDTLTVLARTVTAADPAHAAFGADAPGRPGEVGRALHRQWTAATGDRSREAAAAAVRLAAAAAAVRSAADRYADVDDTAGRRLSGER
ncbi:MULTISPECIES: type VII secretion target [unclassified Micromonospora]|uniref:type VII secretion target n=1 Tax=unclassified Micromonospora TaxID=2617518 RepID=UPI002FF33B22